MKQELERIRKEAVRWANHPSIITAELARKDTPDFKELLWVYRSVIWFLASVIIICAATLDLSSDWTWHTPAIISLFLTIPVAVISLASVADNSTGKKSVFDLKKDQSNSTLDWTGRKQRALLNRNLARMPWHSQRIERMKEADGRYSQLSVWFSVEGTNQQYVQFRILEHQPIAWYLRPVFGRMPEVKVYNSSDHRPAQDYIEITDLENDTERLLEMRSKFEEAAEKLENTAYENAIVTDRLKATVLVFRR